MLILRSFLRLARLDSSLLAFLVIFIPLWTRTGNWAQSFGKALPMLFVYMCAFIANDLDDIEKDRVNHPERPLPAGSITPAFAGILYFMCLGLGLFSTRYYVSAGVAFLYYVLISLHISYGYLVEALPGLKAPYVAAMNVLPILIVVSQYPDEKRLYAAAIATFCLILGREICMDIKDRPGDTISFMHRFGSTRLAIVGFSLQLVGLFSLATQITQKGHVFALSAMLCILVLSGISWFRLSRYWLAIIVMKVQWVVGLYFLL